MLGWRYKCQGVGYNFLIMIYSPVVREGRPVFPLEDCSMHHVDCCRLWDKLIGSYALSKNVHQVVSSDMFWVTVSGDSIYKKKTSIIFLQQFYTSFHLLKSVHPSTYNIGGSTHCSIKTLFFTYPNPFVH